MWPRASLLDADVVDEIVTCVNEHAHALATLEGTAFVAVAATSAVIIIKGFVKTGANPGNLTIQQAKVTSGTASVLAGSQLKVRKTV